MTLSPYRSWKFLAQKASSGAISVEPAPVSEYALAPAGAAAETAVVHVNTATIVAMGSLLRVKGPPRLSGFGGRIITPRLRPHVKSM